MSKSGPAILSGRQATPEAMQAVEKEVEKFLLDNTTFRICLESKVAATIANKGKIGPKYQNAIDRLMAESNDMDIMVSDMFKRELRIYQSINE